MAHDPLQVQEEAFHDARHRWIRRHTANEQTSPGEGVWHSGHSVEWGLTLKLDDNFIKKGEGLDPSSVKKGGEILLELGFKRVYSISRRDIYIYFLLFVDNVRTSKLS